MKEIFKNKVGRPSNETLRKRRILTLVVAIIIAGIIILTASLLTKANNVDLKGAVANKVCTFTPTGGKNKLSVKIDCGKNAKPKYVYLLSDKGALLARKDYDNASYKYSKTSEFKNIGKGAYKVRLVYVYDSNKSKQLDDKSVKITGNEKTFFGLAAKQKSSASFVTQIKENGKIVGIKYSIASGSDAKPYKVVLYDEVKKESEQINDNKEVNIKSYGYSNANMIYTGDFLRKNTKYHLRMYWTVKDNNTGFDIFMKSSSSVTYAPGETTPATTTAARTTTTTTTARTTTTTAAPKTETKNGIITEISRANIDNTTTAFIYNKISRPSETSINCKVSIYDLSNNLITSQNDYNCSGRTPVQNIQGGDSYTAVVDYYVREKNSSDYKLIDSASRKFNKEVAKVKFDSQKSAGYLSVSWSIYDGSADGYNVVVYDDNNNKIKENYRTTAKVGYKNIGKGKYYVEVVPEYGDLTGDTYGEYITVK